MDTYDLLMIAILAGLTIYGYYKGMAWQVAYLASFIASGFVAFRFADRLAPQITFVNPPLNKFVAIAILYAAASLAVWMVFRVVRGAIDKVRLESFDRQMGAFLGFGRGVLWCVGVTFVALTVLPLSQTQKQQVVASRSGYYIARLIDETDSIFPPEVHQVVGPYLDRLGNELNSAGPATPSGGQAFGWPDTQTSAPPAPTRDEFSGFVRGFAEQAASQIAAPPPRGQAAPGGFPASGGFPPPRGATGPGPNAASLGFPQR